MLILSFFTSGPSTETGPTMTCMPFSVYYSDDGDEVIFVSEQKPEDEPDIIYVKTEYLDPDTDTGHLPFLITPKEENDSFQGSLSSNLYCFSYSFI